MCPSVLLVLRVDVLLSSAGGDSHSSRFPGNFLGDRVLLSGPSHLCQAFLPLRGVCGAYRQRCRLYGVREGCKTHTHTHTPDLTVVLELFFEHLKLSGS